MEIAWLEVADSPDLWRSIGFVVDEQDRCVIGGIEHRLVGSDAGTGVVRWVVTGINPDITSIDGLATTVVDVHQTPATPEHPNHVFRIDHLVISTSNTPRTVEALTGVGLSKRGGRTTNSAGKSVDMTFFWAGDTLLEIAGPPQPATEERPARFSGLAYSSDDLDSTVSQLGERSTIPVDAVQPGRRIAALTSEAGSSVPMAFMTPHVRQH